MPFRIFRFLAFLASFFSLVLVLGVLGGVSFALWNNLSCESMVFVPPTGLLLSFLVLVLTAILLTCATVDNCFSDKGWSFFTSLIICLLSFLVVLIVVFNLMLVNHNPMDLERSGRWFAWRPDSAGYGFEKGFFASNRFDEMADYVLVADKICYRGQAAVSVSTGVPVDLCYEATFSRDDIPVKDIIFALNKVADSLGKYLSGDGFNEYVEDRMKREMGLAIVVAVQGKTLDELYRTKVINLDPGDYEELASSLALSWNGKVKITSLRLRENPASLERDFNLCSVIQECVTILL